jgi:hypothetical protein
LTLEITASIVLDPSYDQEITQSVVESSLVSYLSPEKFPYSDERIRKTRLVSLISNIPGVVYLESLSLVGTGDGWLPQFGDDLLFLNKGSLPVLSFNDLNITYAQAAI